jgi:hypothetical protein
MNREAWLEAAIKAFQPLFADAGIPCPDCRVSCGFPSRNALSNKKRYIGECWDGLMSKDGKPQLFISPLLLETGGEQGVLATLVHEMVHAAIGNEAKHGPKFRKAMEKVGLTGKPTATIAGQPLLERFPGVHSQLVVPYPHAELILKRERKVQTTRMHKCECDKCGYTVRLAKKWLDVGIPECPADHVQLTLEQPEEGENE